MANYDYGCPSPSPSPPPADGHTHHLQQASISDVVLYLRRRANDGPADGHSRHREQQQEMHVISLDHRIPPVRKPDGTTSRYMIITNRPHCPEAATVASPHRHHRRANTAATPYNRPEHHERWSNCRRRRSPAPHEDDYEGATKVVCLAKMLWPGDRLEDDEFYRDFLEDVTKEARKFGDLVKVVIPRPGLGIEGGGAVSAVAGVGKVFLEYMHLDDAVWCRKRLDGRWYSGKEITAAFFPQDRFAAGDYDYNG